MVSGGIILIPRRAFRLYNFQGVGRNPSLQKYKDFFSSGNCSSDRNIFRFLILLFNKLFCNTILVFYIINEVVQYTSYIVHCILGIEL